MQQPHGFYWVQEGRVAGLAMPYSVDDLIWLRQAGIELIVTLTTNPLPKKFVNDAGLMSLHVPIEDFEAPSIAQFDSAIQAMSKAVKSGMGVAVHCMAGRGRTGTILAGYLTTTGLSAEEAIQTIRKLRPGSIETSTQENAVVDFANRSGK